jgi:hypothetical protein
MNKLLFGLLLFISTTSFAQKKERKGEFYFSWGYNKEWYTNSNIRVMQPELANDYKLLAVKAHDHPGWDEGLLKIPLSIPQYNYRIGYFFNKKKNLAFEINFDHTKYIIADQDIHIKGTFEGRQVDSTIAFNAANGFNYYLNNGANFLLFNIVKRWNYCSSNNQNFKLDALGKVGIGPVIPHVENTLFGKKNDDGFQLGGWNVGVEYALRATFFKTVYLEFANKLDYAGYSNLKVYKGTARHLFGTYEMILNLGITFPAGKSIK